MAIDPRLLQAPGDVPPIYTAVNDLDRRVRGLEAVRSFIGSGSITGGTGGMIATGAVTGGNIATGTITAGQIAAGSITSALIQAGAIQAGHIEAGAITSVAIAANTITAADIQAGTITSTEIAASTITASDIAAHTITSNEIAASTITSTEIAANTITANDIAANTITTTEIQAGTIQGNDIAAATITGSNIAGTTITGANIVSGTVTSTQISVSQLSAISADLGNITAGTITGGTIRTGSSTPRVEMTSAGIRSFDSLGRISFNVDSTTGRISSLTGSASVGGINLMRNGDFDQNPAKTGTSVPYGWSLYNDQLSPAATLAIIDIDGPVGTRRAARLTNSTDTSGTMGVVTPSNIWGPAVIPTRKYTWSIYGQPSGSGGSWTVFIHWYDAAGSIIGTGSPGGTFNGVSNEWTRAWVTGTAPAGAVRASCYAWVSNPSSGFVFYFGAAQFEEGEFPTPWTRALDDVKPAAGMNILPNTLFRDWVTTVPGPDSPSGWQPYDNGSNTAVWSRQAGAGPNSVDSWRLVPSAIGTNLGFMTSTRVTHPPYDEVALSFWAKGTRQPNPHISNGNTTGVWNQNPAISSTVWQRYEAVLEWNASGGAAGSPLGDFLYIGYVGTAGGTLEIALPMMERGRVSSPSHTPRTDELTNDVVGTGPLQDGIFSSQSITNTFFSAGVIHADRLVASSITAGQIAASTITATQIAAATITSGNIAANTITGGNIAASTVTADKLTVGNLAAISAVLGDVSTGSLEGVLITGSTIRTAATGARVVLDASGITSYNSSNVAAVVIPTTGSASFSGSISAIGGLSQNAATVSPPTAGQKHAWMDANDSEIAAIFGATSAYPGTATPRLFASATAPMSYSTLVKAHANLVHYWRAGSTTSLTDEVASSPLTLTAVATAAAATALITGTDGAIKSAPIASIHYLGTPASQSVTTGLSVEYWFRLDSLPSGDTIIALRGNDPASGAHYWKSTYITSTGKLQFSILIGGVAKLHTTATSIAANTTYHVVHTYDGANIRTYLNGTADGTATAQTGSIDTQGTAQYRAGYMRPGVVTDSTALNFPTTTGQGGFGLGSPSTWTNPGNIVSDNATYATTAPPGGGNLSSGGSEYLYAGGFGFTIPANASISSYGFDFQAMAGLQAAFNPIIYLRPTYNSDVGQAVIQPGASIWSQAPTETVHSFSFTNAANGNFTAAQVNSANFGVALRITNSGASFNNVSVDYFKLRVSYYAVLTLDEIAVYNAALSSTVVTDHYQTGTTGISTSTATVSKSLLGADGSSDYVVAESARKRGTTSVESAQFTTIQALADSAGGASMQLSIPSGSARRIRAQCKAIVRSDSAFWAQAQLVMRLAPADLDGRTESWAIVPIHNAFSWTNITTFTHFRLAANTAYTVAMHIAPASTGNGTPLTRFYYGTEYLEIDYEAIGQ